MSTERIRAVPITRIMELMMQYALVIYETPEGFDSRRGAEPDAYMGAWQAYADALRHAGVLVGGKGLAPPDGATTVRFRDGEWTVQDGPYADTKEQLGGFFILDVPNEDAALQWAARCPMGRGGAVEIRPLLGSCTQTAADAESPAEPALATA